VRRAPARAHRLRAASAVLLFVAGVIAAGRFTAAADTRALSPADPAYWPKVSELEKVVSTDPENLEAGADYRQLLIAGSFFDRSIDFFEKLARQRTPGPNLELNLALAYVDKVPPSNDLRRARLGFNALDALTKSIALKPTVLAYYIRGFINLHFDRGLFHRVDKGVADLEQARTLTTAQTPVALAARVWVTLGDAYWRMKQRPHARELWASVSARYPDDPEVRKRLTLGDADLDRYISHAFDLATRVDTSLAGALR
jgi:tetratricopeptide (TPR) repeat protein